MDRVQGPASESLRRTNPRDSGEQLAGYGDLVARRLLAEDHFAQIGESWKPPMMADRGLPRAAEGMIEE